MFLRPAERAAAGHFGLAKNGGNLRKLVLEDFAQQEDGSLERLELLQKQQEGQRDRFLRVNTFLRINYFGSCRGDDWLRQPGTHVQFPLPAREMQLIHAQARDNGGQKRLERDDL